MSVAPWWPTKIRQFAAHVGARVGLDERAALAAWLTPEQLRLFDAMHPADQRHGLDVMEELRASGETDPDLLVAGLFHDAAKGRATGLWHRVAWSLGERYGTWVWRTAGRLPGFGRALERLAGHADASADLALAAGCSPRAAALIRHRAAPSDRRLVEALRRADEAH